jgi:DNA-binding response OmpR family regulator
MPDHDKSGSWASEEDFLLHVEKELASLREMTGSVNWVNTEAWDAVVRKVHNLRGAAAMVGHPMITRLLEGLETKLGQADQYTDVQLTEHVREALRRAADVLRGPTSPSPALAAPPPAAPLVIPEPAALTAATRKRLKPLNILIVDDDESFRWHLRSAYRPLGMTVFEVDRGTDVTPEYLEKKKIDVVLLDLLLPGENGFETCKRLKANPLSCHVPIVFVSIKTELESRLFGWQVGAEDFTVKPVDPLELLLRTEFLVERAVLKRNQQRQVGVVYEVFLKEMEEKIQKAASAREPLVLATLSLSGAGADPKLRSAGVKFLLDSLRRGDVLCSPAAGYLMVLQTDTSLAAARRSFATTAQRLKKGFGLDCRVGLVEYPTHGKAIQDLLAASKECLDRALQARTESSVITPGARQGGESQPPKLVVVDDDEIYLHQLGRHFAELGFNAFLVGDSRRAVESVRQEKPDLVTLDILMPEPDGLKILDTLKHDPELAAIPVIMISGKGEEESLLQAFNLGAGDYLIKPLRFPELDARVRKLLRESVGAE